MPQIKIQSIVKFKTDVYIKGDDIVKELYYDLSVATNPEVKQYIQCQIYLWEDYMDDARNNVSIHNVKR